MKIIRFINGKKFDQEFSGEIIIENDVIAKAIEKTNNNLKRTEALNYREGTFNE